MDTLISIFWFTLAASLGFTGGFLLCGAFVAMREYYTEDNYCSECGRDILPDQPDMFCIHCMCKARGVDEE